MAYRGFQYTLSPNPKLRSPPGYISYTCPCPEVLKRWPLHTTCNGLHVYMYRSMITGGVEHIHMYSSIYGKLTHVRIYSSIKDCVFRFEALATPRSAWQTLAPAYIWQ